MTSDARGLRQRAEAGAYLAELLEDAGLDARQALVAACPLPLKTPEPDPNVPPEHNALSPAIMLMAAGAPDADQAASQLEAGDPAWLAGAPEAASDAATVGSPGTARMSRPWSRRRTTRGFHRVWSIAFPCVSGLPRIRSCCAPQRSRGGPLIGTHSTWTRRVRWTSRKSLTRRPPTSRDDRPGFPAALLRHAVRSLLAAEDGQVNLGNLEAQPYDLGRLCMAEFALVYGNDWLVVPMDVSAGSFTRLSEVAYTNTFGERITVPLADDRKRSGQFRMFALNLLQEGADVPGFFTPPTAFGSLEGQPLEDVLFLRDEMANMAWAVERFVQGRSGDPRNRNDEDKPANKVEELSPRPSFGICWKRRSRGTGFPSSL